MIEAIAVIGILIFGIVVIVKRIQSYRRGKPMTCTGDCRHCGIECGGVYKRIAAQNKRAEFQKQRIVNGVEDFKRQDRAYLIDVRSPEEYDSGHIQGSINIPLEHIDRIIGKVPDRSLPVYLYCRTGKRAAQAEKEIRDLGYQNVTNIGGILYYDLHHSSRPDRPQ